MSSSQHMTPMERWLTAAVARMEEEAAIRDAAWHEEIEALRAEVTAMRAEIDCFAQLATGLHACLDLLMAAETPAVAPTAVASTAVPAATPTTPTASSPLAAAPTATPPTTLAGPTTLTSPRP